MAQVDPVFAPQLCTLVKDGTADYSDEHMHAALEVDLPSYASAILTTNEIVDWIASPLVLHAA